MSSDNSNKNNKLPRLNIPTNPALKRMNSILKSQRQLQEQMVKFMEPQRQLQEKMAKFMVPRIQLQEQMAKVMVPRLQLQEQMTKFMEPRVKLQEQMAKFIEPRIKLQEQMAKFIEPRIKLQEQMAKFMEPRLELQEQIAKIMEPQRQLQEQMAKFMEPQRQLQKQMTKYMEPLSNYISELDIADFDVCNSESIIINNQTISVEEVNDSISSISLGSETKEQFLGELFGWLEKLHTPVRNVILFLILPYLIAILANLTTPLHEEWWKNYVDYNARDTKKEIISSATEVYEVDELKGFRFVSTRILHVREIGSKKSIIIDEIPMGKIVRLVKKSKRWTFIEYQDDDLSVNKYGWVFTRYLSRFVK